MKILYSSRVIEERRAPFPIVPVLIGIVFCFLLGGVLGLLNAGLP